MALSGNLKEFELPDIFQLIGQQNKTGRLVLQDGDRRAYVVFSQGTVVSAATESTDIITMLSRYLVRARRYPQVKITEFVNFCKGSARNFADVILRIQYVSEEELQSMARMAIEDMTCALFQWRRGAYRFEPSTSVAESMVAGISLTVDAVTMEAMRRVDDWKRIQEALPARTVLVPEATASQALAAPATRPPALEPMRHLLQLLNGTRTVEEVVAASFLSRYRAWEMLFEALQANHLSVSHQASARAASQKAHYPAPENKKETVATTVAALVTAAVMVAVFFCGTVVLPRLMLSERTALARTAGPGQVAAEQKTRIAALQYRFLTGTLPKTPHELTRRGLLSPGDVPPTGR